MIVSYLHVRVLERVPWERLRGLYDIPCTLEQGYVEHARISSFVSPRRPMPRRDATGPTRRKLKFIPSIILDMISLDEIFKGLLRVVVHLGVNFTI